MNVKPILWTYRTRQDGTSTVKLYVCEGGQKLYVTLKVNVAPRDWDARKGQVKSSHPLAATFNAEINKQRLDLVKKLMENGGIARLNQKKASPSLLDFIEDYIEEVKKGRHAIRPSTCKNYGYTLERLRQYARFRLLKDLLFSDVDIPFYHDFSTYLTDHHGCGKTGVGKHIKTIKKFMNEALSRGLHENRQHLDRAFRVHRESNLTKIYLTEEEIGRIEALNLSSQADLERERDRFLLSYYFVMRYSDSVTIRREMLFENKGNNFLRYKSVKTGINAILPVKPRALEIMEKYNYDFSGDTNQEANRKLKAIGAMAGINAEVSEGDKRESKWRFIVTHTARRSAATNMYLQGMSLKVIADLGGWKKIETLKSYLLASGLETAEMVMDTKFFK